MKLWDRLLTLLRMPRGHGLRHYELNERLPAVLAQAPVQTALADRANREGWSAEDLQIELVAVGLDRLNAADKLKLLWDTLSPREKDVTAYTCLGYTNKQIAMKLFVSPLTVKGYMRTALTKWDLHDKSELRLLLGEWDFSAWGPKAP